MIRLFRPTIDERAIDAVGAVLRSGWPGPGALVRQFEEEFAELVGARHAVAVTSCTAAMHLAIAMLDLAPGTEVITTPITFVATNQILLYERLVPVFADVEPDTGNLDMDSVAERITPATGAVMVVHHAGLPCDLDALYQLADQHRIAVVEDCAHACGASYRGRPVGSHRGSQAFSFQATKNLTTVDGGALCLDDPALVERARRLRWMGIDRTTHDRRRADRYCWEYDVAEVGYKYAMNDLNAAIGLGQLGLLEAANERRREIVERYRNGFSTAPDVSCLRPPDADHLSSNYIFPVLVDDRDRVIADLAAVGIESGVHFKRNDLYPMFAESDVPAAERFWRRTLSLPLHLQLTDADVDEVIDAVRTITAPSAARS